MNADVLVAEIGSTTTLVSAFCVQAAPRFLGQGCAPTSVLQDDVRIGLRAAMEDLSCKTDGPLSYGEMFASSSAAGGLKMSVHGLVYDMTVRAAEEAALGAGAVVRQITAGKLTESDLQSARALSPNLVLLAGGTDYGERETAFFNAERIAESGMRMPVIYAGNVQNREAVRSVLERAGIRVYLTENVYPRLDELNMEPCRRIIQQVFEEHIVHAPGMEHVRELVTGPILPTPGACMEAARMLQESIGDLVVLDVGGATTDVHSVAEGSEQMSSLLTRPEPFAKRTVEGDLGLFVNASQVASRIGIDALSETLHADVGTLLKNLSPVPQAPQEAALCEMLCLEAGLTALRRHVGTLRYAYTPTGRILQADGKDLSDVTHVIGTGGALTRLPNRVSILRKLADCNARGDMLFPKPGRAKILFDSHYVMASLGVLKQRYPDAARTLLLESLEGSDGLPAFNR